MTFNGSVPGPLMVVHEDDYVELTLINPDTNQMQHNIDFHAATGALGGAGLTLINPGEQVKLRFRATRAGVFVYANKGHGWDFLHVAVDDASRLAYVELLPSLGREDATGFLNRALAWYARLGAKVERVMTDNGSAYRSKLFATAVQQAQARHIRTRPYTPRTNGKAERFIQTSLREWAYARPSPICCLDSARRQRLI